MTPWTSPWGEEKDADFKDTDPGLFMKGKKTRIRANACDTLAFLSFSIDHGQGRTICPINAAQLPQGGHVRAWIMALHGARQAHYHSTV